MPSKCFKKIKAKPQSSVRQKYTKFPSAKVVSVNLAKYTRDSLIDMQRKIELSKKRQKTEDSENVNEDNHEDQRTFDEEKELPSTLNETPNENAPTVAKKIKSKTFY